MRRSCASVAGQPPGVFVSVLMMSRDAVAAFIIASLTTAPSRSDGRSTTTYFMPGSDGGAALSSAGGSRIWRLLQLAVVATARRRMRAACGGELKWWRGRRGRLDHNDRRACGQRGKQAGHLHKAPQAATMRVGWSRGGAQQARATWVDSGGDRRRHGSGRGGANHASAPRRGSSTAHERGERAPTLHASIGRHFTGRLAHHRGRST